MTESVQYTIITETTDVNEEKTNNLTLTIHGSSGQTAPLSLEGAQEIDPFEKGKSYEFNLEAKDVGSISKINISGSGILIDKITIKKNDESTSVNINKWLEAGGEQSFDVKNVKKQSDRVKSAATTKSAVTHKSNDTKKSNSTVKSEKTSKSINTTKTQKTEKSQKTDNKPVTIARSDVSDYTENKSSENSSVITKKETGQSSRKCENVPIKTGQFEYATHVELKRVKAKLYQEVSKIKYPRRKEYQPFIFNDLAPYTETRLAEGLINSSEFNQPIGYCNRFTAMGIVEPWVAHRMEHTVGPLISRSLAHNVNNKVSRKMSNRPDKYEGSTLAPNFPKVIIKKPKGMNGPFYYNDVEVIRGELQKNLKNRLRFEEDRNRTINDYYRMNLDQTSESLHMTGAYHAYLENTPGSKKALEELLKK